MARNRSQLPWIRLAQKRVISVLRSHTIANSRTLEQKISDAGPFNQRCDPHILTSAKQQLIKEKSVKIHECGTTGNWFYLAGEDPQIIKSRLNEQISIYKTIVARKFTLRVGQALEIAIYRALSQQNNFQYFGGFRDLDDHDDSTLYEKEEPPSMINGSSIHPKDLDFIINHDVSGFAGIEAKNTRAWMYPRATEIMSLLEKCLQLDCVPVLIARRIPFVTFKVFSPCGLVIHQTYNQLFPESDNDLAITACHKKNLGYHDLRATNQPDKRLLKFIGTNLPKVLPSARESFETYKDLLENYVSGDFEWPEFAARVRRRANGTNEDHDWEDGHDYTEY